MRVGGAVFHLARICRMLDVTGGGYYPCHGSVILPPLARNPVMSRGGNGWDNAVAESFLRASRLQACQDPR